VVASWLARLTCRARRDIFRSALLSDETKNQSMRRAVPLALALFAIAACDNATAIRGFSPSPGSVDKLEVNTQSREDVQRLIGSPSAVATFNPNVWYYISEKQEYWGPKRPWISEQNVIQITFNDSGRISSLKYYDLEDAKDITMVARITPTSGKGLTVLEQLLGNVGKFTGPAKTTGGLGAPTSGGG
jgi:outer membrane protein assembly factor BamE (lipoprotein component of BamABCDE complex)